MPRRPTCTGHHLHTLWPASHILTAYSLPPSSHKAKVWEESATAEVIGKQRGSVLSLSTATREVGGSPVAPAYRWNDHVSGRGTKFKLQERKGLLSRQTWMLLIKQQKCAFVDFFVCNSKRIPWRLKLLASNLNTLKDTKLCNSQP